MSISAQDDTIVKKVNKDFVKDYSPHVPVQIFKAGKRGKVWAPTNFAGVATCGMSTSVGANVLRIICLESAVTVLQESLYKGFDLVKLTDHFYAFEGINGELYGLNFTTPASADEFTSGIYQQYPSATIMEAQEAARRPAKKKRGGWFSKKEAEPERVVTISGPTGFKRLSGVTFDPEKGFDCENLPQSWKDIFKAAGITLNELTNAADAAEIMGTMFEFAAQGSGAPPAAPSGMVPPPPPPGGSGSVPPPPPVGGIAPPPPVGGLAAPPPPSNASPAPARPAAAAPPARMNFLADIRAGTTLKKTEVSEVVDPDQLTDTQKGDLISMLSAAMNKRRGAIEEDEYDESDW